MIMPNPEMLFFLIYIFRVFYFNHILKLLRALLLGYYHSLTNFPEVLS